MKKENGGTKKYEKDYRHYHVRIGGDRLKKWADLVAFLERTKTVPPDSPKDCFDYMIDEAYAGLQSVLKDEEIQRAAKKVDDAQAEYTRLLALRGPKGEGETHG